ncbi:hypothetical protein [Micromonospora purpureochromogenes]|uniref:Uncharacterized protein n=1 Tax=Micromonospora purpureochromogenes TaxID=47872 RepID=A0ABX2RUQ2_9ACTN|nr:hypothetical protein [Micromonospora purpureochromogenes]NYF58841.1 hypothetical protein [Micromonospora purpureochromogenes]
MDDYRTHEASVLTGRPQLDGVRMLWCQECYDGPLDGLAEWRGGEHWYVAVGPVWGERPRRYALHQLTPAQAAAAWQRHHLLDGYQRAAQAGADVAEQWDRAWADRPDHRDAPILGWFTD